MTYIRWNKKYNIIYYVVEDINQNLFGKINLLTANIHISNIDWWKINNRNRHGILTLQNILDSHNQYKTDMEKYEFMMYSLFVEAEYEYELREKWLHELIFDLDQNINQNYQIIGTKLFLQNYIFDYEDFLH